MTTLGLKATFKEITDTMNEKSASPSESRSELTLHYKQVYRWFKNEGGVEKSAFEKPRLTDKHKTDRVAWVEEWGGIFLDEACPVCYLDEKWFYTITRRQKLKVLPRGRHEAAGANFIRRPKTRSRRLPIKIMYLGVVGRPRTVNGRRFNGRILLERVSRNRKVVKRTKHSRVSTDGLINHEIKSGSWGNLYCEGMSVDDLCESITDV
jgi:hypothetical protein